LRADFAAVVRRLAAFFATGFLAAAFFFAGVLPEGPEAVRNALSNRRVISSTSPSALIDCNNPFSR
jgi:hypothetical protein